jgi:NADPH:quinone reductase-like Zn-dependent oxidoreductase
LQPNSAAAHSSAVKAAVRFRYGPPEVVRIVEAATPAIKENELLIRVHATTVNRTDCAARAADPFIWRLFAGLVRPRVTILGSEFAGEVEAIGGGVKSYKIGDRVFGYSGSRFGAHAEYMSIPEDGTLAIVPAGLTYVEAAPSTEGSHYALAMIRLTKIRAGQSVLVNGATGAIGSAAVQLSRNVGAGVTAVCGTQHVELVKGLGADKVIDYMVDDFTKDDQTYDVVIDAVGKSTFGRCRRLLKPRGIYVSSDVGPHWENVMFALATPLLGGKKVVFPIPKDDAAMARYFKELIESRGFKPVIDRRYPLDEIVEAYRYVESGRKTGNVVISIDG